MSALRTFRPPIAAAALILLLAASPVSADYRTDYTAGLEAAESQDWPEVERLMRLAVAGKSSEGRVRLYGMRFDPYIPYYWLGVALFEMGDCSGALEAWQISEGQGFITKQDQYADLQARRRSCQERVARAEPTPQVAPTATARPDVSAAVRAARERLDRAQQEAAGLAELRGDASYREAWQSEPSLANRSEQARSALRSAREQLEGGERNASEDQIAGAAELADRAARQYASIRSDLDRVRTELAAEAEAEQRRGREDALRQARGELAGSTSAARLFLDRPEVGELSSQEALAQRRQLEDLLRQAEGADTISSVARIRELDQGIGTQIAALERSLLEVPIVAAAEPTPSRPSGPPRRLRTAAEALFGGNYARALTVLEDADFGEPRAAATAHLLRASASFSLYLAGGEEDENLRRSAIDELRRCLGQRPQITLDPSLFSPRFAELAASLR
jgi:hypothetical protein